MRVAGINGFGLKTRAILKSTDDLNSISDGVFYTANTDNPQNMPPIAAYNNLIIQITSLRADAFQIVMSSTQAIGMFYRVRVGAGGVWSGWYNMTRSLME